MKTLADFVFTLIVLMIWLPIMLLLAITIFLFDFHSPFYVQVRIGRQKRPFKMIKFRSMLNDQVTIPGKVMRRTGIDELPQLINVLLGHMSLVGPRPLTIDDVARLGWDREYYNQRWNVKPGIVGLGQLSPICHKKMSWYLDRYYIHNHNFLLDMKILISSLLIPFVGKSKMKKWLRNK